MTISGRDHSLAINPFLQAMLPRTTGSRVYWDDRRLRWFTPDGIPHETVLEPAVVARWCRHHGFPALLSLWSRHLARRRLLVEHTSVNPVHPLHAGSLRGSLIGGFLVTLFRSAGAEARAHYFVNDLGRQARLLSWVLHRTDRHRLPPDIRFDHAAAVLYALVNMFHAHRAEDLARLHVRHPWLSAVIALADDDHADLQTWLASEQPPDAVLVRRMLDAALVDLTAVGAPIDTVEYESTLPHAPSLPHEIAQQARVATVNGTLCLQRRDGLIPLTRPDGSWLYFTRDVLNTRRQISQAPHVVHVIGSDQDLLQRALRDFMSEATVEHVTFASVTRSGRRFSARQNRLLTLADTDDTHGQTGLWQLALPMLTRRRHTPVDLPNPHGAHMLDALVRAAATAGAGCGVHPKADISSTHTWPLLAALLRTPEALRRALRHRSPHPTAQLLHQVSRFYLQAARHGQLTPWLREYFLHGQAFLAALLGIPLRELARPASREEELA